LRGLLDAALDQRGPKMQARRERRQSVEGEEGAARKVRGLGLAAMVTTLLALVPAADAAKPKLSISDAQATEGQSLTFAIKLSKKAPAKVRAAYAVVPGSASADDFTVASGKLKVKEGKRKAKIVIGSTQDSVDESDETFSIELSRPKRAKLGDGHATATIVDDDPPVTTAPPSPPPPACTDTDSDGVCREDTPADCNDQDASISPNATEIPDNLVDDDCNASTPDGISTTDTDGDGVSVLGGDCNDTLPFVHPGAMELANGIDDDCDGLVDETS
jgi:hypothetical protein